MTGVQTCALPISKRRFQDPGYIRAGPESTPEKNIPAVKTPRLAPKHLQEKLRAEQPPEVTPHIIGPDREEEGGLDIILFEVFQERRNPIPGTVVGIDINSQADFHEKV